MAEKNYDDNTLVEAGKFAAYAGTLVASDAILEKGTYYRNVLRDAVLTETDQEIVRKAREDLVKIECEIEEIASKCAEKTLGMARKSPLKDRARLYEHACDAYMHSDACYDKAQEAKKASERASKFYKIYNILYYAVLVPLSVVFSFFASSVFISYYLREATNKQLALLGFLIGLPIVLVMAAKTIGGFIDRTPALPAVAALANLPFQFWRLFSVYRYRSVITLAIMLGMYFICFFVFLLIYMKQK